VPARAKIGPCAGALAALAIAGCGSAQRTPHDAERELGTLCPHGVLIEPRGDRCIGAPQLDPGTLGARRIQQLEDEVTRLCKTASPQEAAAAKCSVHG
jgi:hypothetical protein